MRYLKARISRRFGERAFTLLEMVFAIMILAILVGVSFAGANHFWKGEKVETNARKIQSMMMRALRLSVANQKPYAVTVEPTLVRLIKAKDTLLVERGDPDVEVVSIEQSSLPSEINIFVRRWQQEDWQPLSLETVIFPVSGICEPVRFRLVHDTDILEFSLHPLTAFPTDETLIVE